MAKTKRLPHDPRRHFLPTWWRDAKLGVFVHWSLFSVPAFAPRHRSFNELLASGKSEALSEVPYAEWYENSLRFPDSSVARQHRENWGSRSYESFTDEFLKGAAQWDPTAWARSFAQSGARYVIFVTKHADGFCLWPSGVAHPHKEQWKTERDFVGELADAVRAQGMRFGVYYCGGWDWSFCDKPVGSMADVVASIPQEDYPAYADAQVRELIDRYQPSIIWNDVAWPGSKRKVMDLFSYYYDAVPDGVVNDRWMPWNPLFRYMDRGPGRRIANGFNAKAMKKNGGLVPPPSPHFDYRTAEYTSFPTIQSTAWECVRGVDKGFGYNASSVADDFIGRDDLLSLFTDTVAKGGNLLVNIGPRGSDAQIPPEHQERLDWLGTFTSTNGDAIFDTQPWGVLHYPIPGEANVRFTSRDDLVFAHIDRVVTSITLPDVQATPTTTVTSINGSKLTWTQGSSGLEIDCSLLSDVGAPFVVVLHGVVQSPAKRENL